MLSLILCLCWDFINGCRKPAGAHEFTHSIKNGTVELLLSYLIFPWVNLILLVQGKAYFIYDFCMSNVTFLLPFYDSQKWICSFAPVSRDSTTSVSVLFFFFILLPYPAREMRLLWSQPVCVMHHLWITCESVSQLSKSAVANSR